MYIISIEDNRPIKASKGVTTKTSFKRNHVTSKYCITISIRYINKIIIYIFNKWYFIL